MVSTVQHIDTEHVVNSIRLLDHRKVGCRDVSSQKISERFLEIMRMF